MINSAYLTSLLGFREINVIGCSYYGFREKTVGVTTASGYTQKHKTTTQKTLLNVQCSIFQLDPRIQYPNLNEPECTYEASYSKRIYQFYLDFSYY